MRTPIRLFAFIFIAWLSLLAFASVASAQCGPTTTQFDNIGPIPNNPFQTDEITTHTGPPAVTAAEETRARSSVARDGDGRVRVERFAGEFVVHEGNAAEGPKAAHVISICDPVAQTLTQIDTLAKTARVRHSQSSGRLPTNRLPATTSHQSFCSRINIAGMRSGAHTEDLGQQIIEGVEAHGLRVTIKPLSDLGDDSSSGETVIETWCSDELAALLVRTTESLKSGYKTSTSFTNLQRQEPDPSLFQIPADYTMMEAVREERSVPH